MQHLTLDLYTAQDIAKAKRYWRRVFEHHAPQLPELHNSCVISIIVPVYDEHVSRLEKQLKSFKRQLINPKKFEVIYVVNNNSQEKKGAEDEAFIHNQRAIQFLRKYKDLTVHVIDRSSHGLEIPACNVGKARNIALAEVTKRYADAQRDGIIFQTDADARLSNLRHMSRIISAFKNEPNAFGAAGGVMYEMDPDAQGVKRRQEYVQYFEQVKWYFQWHNLLREKFEPNLKPPAHPTRFSGMHMISRALASACVGGITPVNYAEDTLFGEALNAFAKKHNGYILEKREEWYVISALRESLRTEASFGNIMDKIIRDKGVIVSSEDAPYFRNFVEDALKGLMGARTIAKARNVLFCESDFGERITDVDLENLRASVKKAKNQGERYAIYRKWRTAIVGVKRGPIEEKYFTLYPQIRLTKHRLESVKKALHQDPIKKAHYDNVMKHFYRFRNIKSI